VQVHITVPSFFHWDGVSPIFFHNRPWTMILLIYASQVTRITGSHRPRIMWQWLVNQWISGDWMSLLMSPAPNWELTTEVCKCSALRAACRYLCDYKELCVQTDDPEKPQEVPGWHSVRWLYEWGAAMIALPVWKTYLGPYKGTCGYFPVPTEILV
jgi:hypothetical protein